MKKRNENDQNIREDNSEELSDEALGFINRLLEQMHQADFTNHGSKIEVVYVASGGQHVETQYISLTPRSAEGRLQGKNPSPARPLDACYQRDARKAEGKGTILPEALSTEEAMALWEKAQEAGYVDEHYQPKISRTQAALLADAMAKRLGIKEKWKVFEALWNRRNMYRDYQDALDQRQSSDFLDILKELF